ncbi:MAG: prolyl oligopeptidase family serine peptidase [Anaerolineae bacterium]|nr:prolyl oligopeptidase family serine peptidase [Anaerolineae bacterium]
MKIVRYMYLTVFIVTLSLVIPALAGAQESTETVITSITATTCLGVGADNTTLPSTDGVWINWQGQVKEARLIVRVAGANAAHTITLNDRAVATVPIQPGGEACGGQEFTLDIPVDAVYQGENMIAITNDALSGDSWTATGARLEIVTDSPPPAEPTPEVGIAASFTKQQVVSFTSSYDATTQEFKAQIPSGGFAECATLSPTPLVIYVHGRSSSMEEPFNSSSDFAPTMSSKGWLLAAPNLHSTWPDNTGANAYASLESQADIVDTVEYMVDHCNVNKNRIYLYGSSMGGQTGLVTVAKYPHIFAALFDNKGPSDMTVWFNEGAGGGSHRTNMKEECNIGGDPKKPTENPFCYERRSGLNFARNYFRVPVSITHSISDTLVPIHHSFDMRDGINSYSPDYPTSVSVDTVVGPTCNDNGSYHCYEPDTNDVLNFFQQYTLNNTPTHIKARLDMSKPFYWLDITQSGGDHWTAVESQSSAGSKTVTTNVTDPNALTLGFNLGSNSQTEVVPIPGLGLPATTYLVKGGGLNQLKDYNGSGYFTVSPASTGTYAFTISAINVTLSADDVVSGGNIVSTITAVVKDKAGNVVPNGTAITFVTDQGTFANSKKTYNTTISGGQGQAIAVLTTKNDAIVEATVKLVSNTVLVDGNSNSSEPENRVFLPVVLR